MLKKERNVLKYTDDENSFYENKIYNVITSPFIILNGTNINIDKLNVFTE